MRHQPIAAALLIVFCTLTASACQEEVKQQAERGQQKKAQASDLEATGNLRALADGARAYFLAEHAAPGGMTVVTHVFPHAPSEVCSATSEAETIEPSATRWNDEPWRSLRFSISRPHAFQYCYQSAPDAKRFVAWAIGRDQSFCIEGSAGSDGEAKISAPREVRDGEPGCGL